MILGTDDDRILGGLMFMKGFPEDGIRDMDMAIAYENLVCSGVEADIHTLPEYLHDAVQEAIDMIDLDPDEDFEHNYYPGGLARLKKEAMCWPECATTSYYAWDSKNHEYMSFWYTPVYLVVKAIVNHYKVPIDSAAYIESFEPDGAECYTTLVWNECFGETDTRHYGASEMILYMAEHNPDMIEHMMDDNVMDRTSIWSAWATFGNQKRARLLKAAEINGSFKWSTEVLRAAGKLDKTND